MTEITCAGAADLDKLATLITSAFLDLPPSRWLVDDEAERRRIFPGYFRLYLDHAYIHGQIHVTSGLDAVALWLPSGKPPPDGYPGRLAAVTAPWTERFVQFDAELDARHPTEPQHQHLAILAVDPGRQDQGLGTALLMAHHRTLDHAGQPSYLEASSERSRELYLRHGYADHGPAITLPGGPPMYPMLRTPLPSRRPGGTAPHHQ